MTGYGRGLVEGDTHRITVEMRSVNHRFLDLKLRGVHLEPVAEDKLRKSIGKAISRGAVSVSARIEQHRRSEESHIVKEAAIEAHRELSELSSVLGLGSEVPLSLVLQRPGVLVARDSSEEDAAQLADGVTRAALLALEQLVEMRDAEGKRLETDVKERCKRLEALAKSLATLAASSPAEHAARLKERVERLLAHSDVQVEEARLAQEIAIAADKLDVTEELVRISSHLAQITALGGAEEPIGRRLDFLVQELGREFNTIASKSQSAEIAGLVVEAKAEMEKIREQVQNIE